MREYGDMSERFSLRNLLAIKSYKQSGMVLSFTMLRFVATCFITNTHYDDVYPISALAVGGLLGDVLFFMVSGFVLCRPTKEKFIRWYWKRIVRIYPTVFAGVLIYLLSGFQTIGGRTLFNIFVFPTLFEFAAAIIILYIPLYYANRIKRCRNYLILMSGVMLCYILVYLLLFDKSSYQMNNTGIYMIGFPYFMGMLFGGYLRKFAPPQIKGKVAMVGWFLTFICCCIYYFMNNIIRGNESLYKFQLFVPWTLLLAVGLLVYMFYSSEDFFWRLPEWVLKSINFISALTLEMYVIQRPIINRLSFIMFPLNWIIITLCIILGALLLRVTINLILEIIKTISLKIARSEENI